MSKFSTKKSIWLSSLCNWHQHHTRLASHKPKSFECWYIKSNLQVKRFNHLPSSHYTWSLVEWVLSSSVFSSKGSGTISLEPHLTCLAIPGPSPAVLLVEAAMNPVVVNIVALGSSLNDPVQPPEIKLLPILFEWRQLPNKASFHELCDDVRVREDSPRRSARITFPGFSSAFNTCRMVGRFDALEWRQALAMIAIAQTSSSKSSSTIKVGSTNLGKKSLLWLLIRGSTHSNQASAAGSVPRLIPCFPETSSNSTFPKL